MASAVLAPIVETTPESQYLLSSQHLGVYVSSTKRGKVNYHDRKMEV